MENTTKIRKIDLPDGVGNAWIIDSALKYERIRFIYNEIQAGPFMFQQMSEPHSSIPNTRMSMHLDPDWDVTSFLEDFAGRILKAVRKTEPKGSIVRKNIKEGFVVSEMYVNIADAMSVMLPHCDRPQGHMTLLYYPCIEWDIKYGGATNFLHDGEIVASVIPKPGRFILFDADIEHQATPPNFYCPHKRYTIAFKMDPSSKFQEPQELLDETIEQGSKCVETNTCWKK